MKKRLVLLLGVLIGMFITAEAGIFSFLSKKKSNEPTKLVIAARGGSHVKAMEAVKATFEAENNCEIEILGLEGGDLKQKIALDTKNKKGNYDLIMADDPWMPELAKAKVFAKLSDYNVSADADFVPASLNLGKYPYASGELYALPFAGNVQLFFYNKEIFKSGNFNEPKSWEEVIEIAEEVNSKKGKVGYLIRGQQGNPIVSDFLPVFWSYGAKVFDSSWNATVDSPEAVAALEAYVALYHAGANYDKSDIVSSVADGKAAMSLGWPSWYISGDSSSAEYMPIPGRAMKSSKTQETGMIGNWMMGVTSNSQNKELAAKFLVFVTSAESQKKMVDFGGVPTRKSVYLDDTLKAKYKHFPTQLRSLENSVARPRTPKWSQVETAFGAELSEVIAGKKSAEDALAAAKIQINNIMK